MRIKTITNNQIIQARISRSATLLCASAIIGGAFSVAGCGGGAGSNALTSGRAGGLQLTIKWPAPSRLIPAASSSINAVLTSGTTALGAKLLVRPTEAPWTSTVSFPNLNAGSVTLTASAFPSPDGSGAAQAVGTAPAVIVSGQEASVTVDMTSTIDHLTINPPSPTVVVGSTLQLSETAYSQQGAIVLTAVQNINWTSKSTGFATITNTGYAFGVAAGTSLITVTESESQKRATATITITAPVVAPNTGPRRVAVDNTGKFVYVLDQLTKTVSQFSIGANGTLTPLTPASVTLTVMPYNLLIDPAAGSSTLWVCGSDISGSALFQFDINANGTLSPKATPTVPSTSSPQYLVANPSGKFMYELDESNGLRAFIVNSDGSLTQNGAEVSSQQSEFFAGQAAPDGKALYVSSGGGGGIRIYQIHTDGTVTLSSSVSDSGTDMKIAPSGPYLYLCKTTGVDAFKINADDTLTQIGTSTHFSAGNYQLAVTPDGKNLFSIAQLAPDNEVAQFAINSDGTLTPHSPATVLAGNYTSGISVTPNGKYVYVVNSADNTVSMFQINADGTLTPTSPPTVPG